MVHLARPGGLHPLSTASLRAALWTKADVELRPVDAFNEDELDWGDAGFLAPESLSPSPVQCCTEGWFWHNHEGKVVTAPAWGGNLEVLHWNLAASRWIRADVGDYAGCVLLLETSEEMPTATEVYRMLRNAGERGLLAQFPAVLVARPKASSRDVVRTADERVVYRREQRDAMLKAFKTYAPGAMVVFNLDFGHTDPQYILPYGGEITVDGIEKKVIAHFG